VIDVLRHEGPAWWFDRAGLREAVVRRFGRASFRARVAQMFPAER
jgi:hypothetical protein